MTAAGALDALAELARRLMLRTGRGPLRPLWSLAYRVTARGLAAHLRRGHRHSTAYVRGSVGGPNALFGVSDIDLVVVAPSLPGRRGATRALIARRWERLCRAASPLSELVYLAVYEDADLAEAAASSPCLHPPDATGMAMPLPGPRADPAQVASRPGLVRPMHDWRRIAGPECRPETRPFDRPRLRLAAWLEVQHWWRWAFEACLDPVGPRKPYLCVKMVSEPARVWLALVCGEQVDDRRVALERALEVLPEESEALERALELHRALPRAPRAPVAELLPSMVRMTSRISRRLGEQVESAGVTEVRLAWGGEDELVLPPRAHDPLRALVGAEPRLLPLADWRALASPRPPDEAFALLPGRPEDLDALAAAAVGGRVGPYPALAADGLLVLPTSTLPARALLRAVHCPTSDPASFALLGDRPTAHYPNVAGWSIQDTATQAVAAHRAWLAAGGGAGAASVDALSRLLTAARAALLLESLDAGDPELALTVATVADRLGARDGAAREAADASSQAYRACRSGGGEPPRRTIAALRACVAALPAYRHPSDTAPPALRVSR